MDYVAIRVRGHGISLGGYHRDDDRGHHGHHYGGNIRFNGGRHHSSGSISFSNGGGGYHDGGYDPTFAGQRFLEKKIFGERDPFSNYDPTFAGQRYLERKLIEAEQQQYESNNLPVGSVPSYGPGYVGPRREATRSFDVRDERQLIAEDRISTPQPDEFPQEATGRPATDTQPKQAEAPGTPAPAPATQPPAAEASKPVEQPRAAEVPAGMSAEQKVLNQKAQVYLEMLGQDTGQLDQNGKRTPGAGQKKLSAATEQTPLDEIAKGFDGLVGPKTKEALRKAGLNPDAPITQETLDALAGKVSVERVKAEAQAQSPQQPLELAPAAATVAKPLAAMVSPTAAVTTALNQPNPQPEAAVAAVAPAAPPAQPSDIGVSAGGPPVQLSALFSAMQGFGSAPETSAPVQPAPVAMSRPLAADDIASTQALFANTGVTGGQNVSTAGAPPTNIGQRPVAVSSVGPV